jgi:membrane-anchored glycerophosphoryl diester phosphodiesterase (GDPDase)
MTSVDIRPLSLGEILDRSFSLYRDHFRLFLGISIIPHLPVLAWGISQVWLVSVPSIRARALGIPTPVSPAATFVLNFTSFIVEFFAVYLLTQAPTAYAVSEIYLGRTLSIASSFGRMRRRIWPLAAYTLLSGTAILLATLLFLVPGISLACRLITALPAAALENLGPGKAFRRSFRLTRDHAGRALVICFLYFFLRLVAFTLLLYPERLAAVMAQSEPGIAAVWLDLIAVASVFEATLIGPFLTIAATVFYFDLRVRKEALDLQLMLNAEGELPRIWP